MQVDFASFRGLVEAVGGVTVPFPYPARDEQTGLLVTEAGCHTLDPVEALAYVRSRFYEQYVDGEWVTDVRSDIGRIERQQDFIRRALQRAIDRGARNPATLDQLIDVALSGIVVDDELTADDIFDLARRFRSFDPDDLVTYALEGTPDTVGEAQVLRLVEGPETEAVLSIFRGSSTTEIEPEGVRLVVHNGTGAPRQGAEAAEALRSVGFIASVAGDEPGAGAEGTIVRHPPAQAAAADLVARWLVGGARLESTRPRRDRLVTGIDWQVRDELRPPTSTTSTTLPEPSTTTTTSTTTSTTTPGGAGPRRQHHDHRRPRHAGVLSRDRTGHRRTEGHHPGEPAGTGDGARRTLGAAGASPAGSAGDPCTCPARRPAGRRVATVVAYHLATPGRRRVRRGRGLLCCRAGRVRPPGQRAPPHRPHRPAGVLAAAGLAAAAGGRRRDRCHARPRPSPGPSGWPLRSDAVAGWRTT